MKKIVLIWFKDSQIWAKNSLTIKRMNFISDSLQKIGLGLMLGLILGKIEEFKFLTWCFAIFCLILAYPFAVEETEEK